MNEVVNKAINDYFATLPKWNIKELCGYKPRTTFWSDFSIADRFDDDSIVDTFNRAFSEWKTNYIYLTELALVLNHKAWEHQDNPIRSMLYVDLWKRADLYACENLRGDELSYYLQTTD